MPPSRASVSLRLKLINFLILFIFFSSGESDATDQQQQQHQLHRKRRQVHRRIWRPGGPTASASRWKHQSKPRLQFRHLCGRRRQRVQQQGEGQQGAANGESGTLQRRLQGAHRCSVAPGRAASLPGAGFVIVIVGSCPNWWPAANGQPLRRPTRHPCALRQCPANWGSVVAAGGGAAPRIL